MGGLGGGSFAKSDECLEFLEKRIEAEFWWENGSICGSRVANADVLEVMNVFKSVSWCNLLNAQGTKKLIQ